MANGTSFVTDRKKTIGDVAVDGLLAGMAAGVVMGFVLVLLSLLDGVGPLDTLRRFDPAGGGAAAVGGLLHLAVSGIYGVIYAILFRLLGERWPQVKPFGWVIGAIYGILLWLSAHLLFLPGLDMALAEFAPIAFALAHLVYGLGIGYLIGRNAG